MLGFRSTHYGRWNIAGCGTRRALCKLEMDATRFDWFRGELCHKSIWWYSGHCQGNLNIHLLQNMNDIKLKLIFRAPHYLWTKPDVGTTTLVVTETILKTIWNLVQATIFQSLSRATILFTAGNPKLLQSYWKQNQPVRTPFFLWKWILFNYVSFVIDPEQVENLEFENTEREFWKARVKWDPPESSSCIEKYL